jgi:hypothetical protein
LTDRFKDLLLKIVKIYTQISVCFRHIFEFLKGEKLSYLIFKCFIPEWKVSLLASECFRHIDEFLSKVTFSRLFAESFLSSIFNQNRQNDQDRGGNLTRVPCRLHASPYTIQKVETSYLTRFCLTRYCTVLVYYHRVKSDHFFLG